jgi:ATP-binding cassette, subfamily B, bacterial
MINCAPRSEAERHDGRPHRDLSLFRRILYQARPYRLHLSGLFALGLLASPIRLLTPLPLKIVVDNVLGGRPMPSPMEALLSKVGAHSTSAILALAVILLIGISILSQLQLVGTLLLGTFTGERLVLDFRAHLFERVQRLSISYHDIRGSADSIYRIQTDAMALQYVTIDGLLPLVSATCALVAMIYVMARIDWQMAAIALLGSPFLFKLSRTYRPLLRDQARQVRTLETSALSVVQEVLSAARVVQAFGREEYEQDRYIRKSREGMRARLRLALAESSYALLVGIGVAVGTASVLWLGVRHVQAGSLSLGNLLLIMGYLAQLYEPLKVVGRKSASLQGHLASLERAFHLLDELPEVAERPNARPLSRASGTISYRNVSFAYEVGHPVLHDIAFDVPAGSHVGIAGETGAGKTTLVSLLCRFYDPTAGEILLDGVDLRDYKLHSLRDQFALVSQEPVLFSTSIAENISYARPGATIDEIVDAAKAAGADRFIRNLPNGYETLVGQRGMRLSGGERQRISLARAFLKNAPILLLDEPTSSVDSRTEALIMDALTRLIRGRTAFLIAHRLSTLELCDLRLSLENGRIVSVERVDQTRRVRSS